MLIVGHGFGGAVGWACLDRLQRKGLGHRMGRYGDHRGPRVWGQTRTIRGTCRRRRASTGRAARACFTWLSGTATSRSRSRSSSTRRLWRKKAEAAPLQCVSGADHGFASRRDVAFTALATGRSGHEGQIPVAKRKKKKGSPRSSSSTTTTTRRGCLGCDALFAFGRQARPAWVKNASSSEGEAA